MTPRAGRPLVTGLAVAGALAVAWLLPSVAVVTVWPLLLFVPGWVLLARLQPRIDTTGRVGLAVVISVAASTHLVYWLSQLAHGYGRGTVFVAAGLLALGCVAGVEGLGLRRPSAAAIARNSAALAVAGVAALLVGGVLAAGMWRVTPGGVSSGGSNWSDLGVHLSISETLNAGANFPPEVPYFSGVPLVYHWFADFHAAILAEAAGIFSVPAMVVQSSVLAAALALLALSLARRLLRGPHALRAAVIAATLAVFAGGLGWSRLIGDMTVDPMAPNAPPQAGDLVRLIANNSYDNQWLTGWPYFRIPSVMGTGLLAHRATTAGLPILVGAVLLLVAGLPAARQRIAGWRDRPSLIFLAGLMGALLAPFHFFFFPVFPLLALAWVLTGRRLFEQAAWRNAAMLLAPYALAAPFVMPPLVQAAGSGALRIVAGWASAPLTDGLPAIVFFYLTNLGIPFALALVAIFAPRVPHRGFLAAWAIGLFLVPNILQVSVIDFDMNKYFQAMWVAVALLAAWLIRRWSLPAVAAVVALSIPSPMLVATWTATSNLQVISAAELTASRWVAANTPPGAVFVTDGWVNSLTDAAGRRRLTTFGPYVANLGYQPDQRISDVISIYCGGDASVSAELMRRYGASYVVDGSRPQPCVAPVEFGASPAFELVYDAGPLIWRLVGP
ncbi:MAG: hypothetical protein LC744_02915 [Chloroflexi bacterium]|nr:hypothetical protein [Chloroflexota bacterium]